MTDGPKDIQHYLDKGHRSLAREALDLAERLEFQRSFLDMEQVIGDVLTGLIGQRLSWLRDIPTYDPTPPLLEKVNRLRDLFATAVFGENWTLLLRIFTDLRDQLLNMDASSEATYLRELERELGPVYGVGLKTHYHNIPPEEIDEDIT